MGNKLGNKYWEKRKAQRMFEHMQTAEESAEQIAKLYLKVSGYTSNQMDKIYDRFKRKHSLSDKEAMNLLNTLEDPTSLQELKQVLNRTNSTKEKEELRTILESPAYRARLDRLQQLQSEIDVMMDQVYKQEKLRSTSHYINLANDSYYKGIYDVQQATGLGFSFDTISPKQVDKLLQSKWSGMNYSDRIWQNTHALAKDIKRELLVNLMTGRTDRETSEILSNKFGTGAMEARRLVRTESAYIANEMEAESYEECEIDEYIFVATLDIKTSKECQALDMKKFKVKDRQAGNNCPPMHPWCRSTTIAYLDDETLASLTRRARDPETGKTNEVPGDMDYPTWHEKYVENVPAKLSAEKSCKNKRTDRIQYDKYNDIIGKENMPESFEKFQQMKYNDSDKWNMLKDYKKSRSNNMVSSFTPFDQYVEYKNRIADELVGMKTSDGIEIKTQSKHFIERVFGTTKDPKTGRGRDGVSIEDIKDAMNNPLNTPRDKINQDGNSSRKYLGENVEVSINPDTGVLIQVNPMSSDKRRRLKKNGK